MQQPDIASDPEIKALTAQAEQLAVMAATYNVATASQYADAGAELKRIKGAAKDLDELKKKITKPLDEARKGIMALFRIPEERFTRAESCIKRAMIAYNEEQDRICREAQRKADEAARREQERLAAQAAKAAASGKTDKAALLEERAAFVVAPVIQREAPKVSGVSMREVWLFEVMDAASVPREYCIVDESKVRKIVNALKGDAKIPGVRVYSEKRMASGAA